MIAVEDDDWDRMPTALEAAHYDAMLTRMQSREAEARASEEARKRRIFGDCLRKLILLGMIEGKARSMLGKWRSQAKDDVLLIRIVDAAAEIATPDPVSYVTKALSLAALRSNKVSDLRNGTWLLLGWEKPTDTASGRQWRTGTRGQVWRDPFGKTVVLPAPEGAEIPAYPADPGIDTEKKV